MARQLCSRGMCIYLLRSDGQQWNYGKAKFPSEFELRAKIVSETGPSSMLLAKMPLSYMYKMITAILHTYISCVGTWYRSRTLCKQTCLYYVRMILKLLLLRCIPCSDDTGVLLFMNSAVWSVTVRYIPLHQSSSELLRVDIYIFIIHKTWIYDSIR